MPRAAATPSPAGFAPLRSLMDCLPLERVVAVILFGSVARGDDDSHSDLDVLVVTYADRHDLGLRSPPAGSGRPSPAPLVMSGSALLEEAATRPSFVAHLLDEGIVVHEGVGWVPLRRALTAQANDAEALARELRLRCEQLSALSKPERFQAAPMTARSHLFGIARGLVILRLLQAGVHEYSWRRAFDRYAVLRPDLRDDLDLLKALRPYYEYARARPQAAAPDLPSGRDNLERLVAAGRHLSE